MKGLHLDSALYYFLVPLPGTPDRSLGKSDLLLQEIICKVSCLWESPGFELIDGLLPGRCFMPLTHFWALLPWNNHRNVLITLVRVTTLEFEPMT